jgi:hypothetical protein
MNDADNAVLGTPNHPSPKIVFYDLFTPNKVAKQPAKWFISRDIQSTPIFASARGRWQVKFLAIHVNISYVSITYGRKVKLTCELKSGDLAGNSAVDVSADQSAISDGIHKFIITFIAYRRERLPRRFPSKFQRRSGIDGLCEVCLVCKPTPIVPPTCPFRRRRICCKKL